MLTILDQKKIRPEVTTSLNKDITCCINNHAKNISKYIKKTFQSDPKWLLFGAWEPPWNHAATRQPNYALI